jgi:hypothetical protein
LSWFIDTGLLTSDPPIMDFERMFDGQNVGIALHREMAKTVSLVHPQQRFQVAGKLLIRKDDLFRDDSTVTVSHYTLT